jgi:hypothetical protein
MQAPGQQTHDVWLHFHALTPFTYTVTRASAGGSGSGAIGSPVPFARNWDEAKFKLKQAGFTDDAITSIGEELTKNRSAVCGPFQMSAQQGAALGLPLPA